MQMPAAASPPRPPVLLEREDWAVLARARAEALAGLFPDWRIWLDQAGWHARRRQDAYLQAHHNGAPAYSVHAATPTALAAQLCWQQAADQHAPDGCTTRVAAAPGPGPPRRPRQLPKTSHLPAEPLSTPADEVDRGGAVAVCRLMLGWLARPARWPVLLASGPGCLAGTRAVCGYRVRVHDRPLMSGHSGWTWAESLV